MKTKVTNSETSFQNVNQELINGCKNGDQKAQFKLYKQYYKAMYNTSLKIVKNSMEAEDIMQESFLAAFDAIESYSGTVSFGAWLKRIVYNRSLDYLRKNSRLVFVDIENYLDLQESSSEDLYVEEETERRASKVKEMITTLPEKCRKVLSLYLFEGYDHEEISEILSISASTSRSQFSRVRSDMVCLL